MRRTLESKFLLDDGKIVGIDLGADFCAEHEWGIEQIKGQLGIPQDPVSQGLLGIEGRRIRKFPEESFRLVDSEGYKLLVFHEHIERWDNYEYLSSEMRLDGKVSVRAAWDESSFAIAAIGQEVGFLETLFEAFKNKDVAIWLGGGKGSLANAGLVIVIVSLVSANNKEAMLKTDDSRRRLFEAVKATGIEEKLKAAGKGYFDSKGYMALSPQWIDKEETAIRFWLNPMDQKNDDCGWFTVRDLLDWIEGKGSIPMKARK